MAKTILIVDDDTELRTALVEQLALHDEFEAIAVDTGTKGVQAAKTGQIDLVIMDVGLPDVDGREAVRILRKNGFKVSDMGYWFYANASKDRDSFDGSPGVNAPASP